MIYWLRIMLVALALVAGVTELAVAATDTSAEISELETLDVVLVTDAPELPRLITALDTTADSRLPESPSFSPLLRPPRLPT